MWMMGYNDDFNNIPDSFNGRKLRPLIPRPAPPPSPPCLTRIHASSDHFFALNHHLASMGEQNKREFNMQASSVVVSSRWNPTPEQLRTLEELYRRGTRTPSADQIQHITAQLRRYGKIEGKNVFYWFQNHKARERQKRRRQMECLPQDHDHEMLERKDNSSGGGGSSTRVAGFEVEQNKNWAPSSTHCTTTPPEEGNSREQRRATKPTTAATECRTESGWVQYDDQRDRELLHQQQHMIITRNFVERNATWHTMPPRLPCPPPRVSATATKDYHRLNLFLTDHNSSNTDTVDYDHDQTLELFPLRSENTACANHKLVSLSAMDAPPNYQFFEFLPLKN